MLVAVDRGRRKEGKWVRGREGEREEEEEEEEEEERDKLSEIQRLMEDKQRYIGWERKSYIAR